MVVRSVLTSLVSNISSVQEDSINTMLSNMPDATGIRLSTV